MSWFKRGLVGVIVVCCVVYLAMDSVVLGNLRSNPTANDILVSNEVKSLLASLAAAQHKEEDDDDDAPPQPQSPPHYELDPSDLSLRYFVYQPLSGFKQEQQMLRQAIVLANAMDRTLVLPNFGMFAANGYSALDVSSEMAPASALLDVDALDKFAVKRGVRLYRGHLDDLPKLLSSAAGVSITTNPAGFNPKWKRNTHRVSPSLQDLESLAKQWGGGDERVVYWSKAALTDCCASAKLMAPYVMPHEQLKRAAQRTIAHHFPNHANQGGGGFPCVQAHTHRYALQHFVQTRLLANGINSTTPVFIYTEDNINWFNPLREAGFKLVFAHHSRYTGDREADDALWSQFPPKLHAAVQHWISQLVCAQATVWVPGEDPGAIDTYRNLAALHSLSWRQELEAGDASSSSSSYELARLVYDASEPGKGLPKGRELSRD